MASGAATPTVIVMLVRPDRIIVGADSKVVETRDGARIATRSECKIFRCPTCFVAVGGLYASPNIVVDFRKTAQDACASGQAADLATHARAFEKSVLERLPAALQNSPPGK